MTSQASVIIPAGVLDSSHATDSIILNGWVLDGSIDAAKVKAAWLTLLTAWPLLGARLVFDKSTNLWEYHIPAVPPQRTFASIQISASLREYYNYAQPSSRITVTSKENPFHLFCPYGPRSVEELLREDRSVVHLHVTSFDDGSLVGLATPHILCDGHGATAIIQALCQLINGGSPPPPLNLEDPFESYASEGKLGKRNNEEVTPPQWRIIGKLGLALFYLRSLWESIFEDKIENKDVYFPKQEVERIKAIAMSDIRRVHGQNTKLYVSSSDAILAFCLQCTHARSWSLRPLSVFYTANLRSFLTELKPPFLRNTVLMPIVPPLPLYRTASIPLGQLALRIRQTLVNETTEEARDRWLKWRIKHSGKMMLFFNPLWGAWNIVTNWREMKLMNVDFSGAAQATAKEEETQQIRCLYAWGNGLQPYPLKNWIGLWADDPSGGVWVSGFLQRKVWENKHGFGRFVT